MPATNQTTLLPAPSSAIIPPHPFYRRARCYPLEMSEASDFVTVYRSMDANAKEDCETIIDILKAHGIDAVMLDDSAPGVPEGTFEVQVPAGDAMRAEETIAENPLPDEV